MKTASEKKIRPAQQQQRPGVEKTMNPQPIFDNIQKKGSGKLKNKVALISGGDSGIGKAVAVLFAKEGAEIAIAYLSETNEAASTAAYIKENYGKDCMLIKGDLGKENHCKQAVNKLIKKFGKIDILINNAALHYENKKLEDITSAELLKTFQTNIISFFYLTQAVLPYMKKNAAIVNTSSVTAYRGSAQLIDYAATKGAIVSFTRSLATSLLDKGIRVNGVAPGPVWTPLIPSTFSKAEVAKHGSTAPMKRSAQPVEIAPCYLFLACDDSSYITGQFLHPNGGEIING